LGPLHDFVNSQGHDYSKHIARDPQLA
jgi:hypothetical protein